MGLGLEEVLFCLSVDRQTVETFKMGKIPSDIKNYHIIDFKINCITNHKVQCIIFFLILKVSDLQFEI